jgi:hypothetical protein
MLRDSVIIIFLGTHEIWSFKMADKCYSEEEKSKHNYILGLISKKERKYFYTFGYGASFVFLCLIRNNLESGGLLGFTTILALACFGMWLGTNPIIDKYQIYYHIRGGEPESIISRYSDFSSIANKIGIASIVSMVIANYMFL